MKWERYELIDTTLLKRRKKEKKEYIFKKDCIRCNELFKPTGRFQRICEDCVKERKKVLK